MRSCRRAVFVLAIASALGCGKKVEPVAQSAPVLVQGATVAVLAAEQIPEHQEAVGTVRAHSSAQLSARIAGSVNRVYVTEGDRVAKGELLLTIDAAESGAAAAGARSGVEEAARSLEEARSRKKLADATFERYRRLFDQQAVTRQEFEVRQMEQEVANEGVARAQARLGQARQSASAAGTVAGYGKVTSPLSGQVLAKQVEAGQTVFPGTPLVTIEGDQGYRLEVAAPEGLLGKVQPGDQVGISVEGAPLTGRVSEVLPMVDPVTRTFTVKIDLKGKGLRSGAYGKARFRSGVRAGIAVPEAAVVERGALTSVWTVSPEGIAKLRLVKLGRAVDRRVEVLSGLSVGEKIVVAGVDRVTDGARVQ
jgi:multidrug efflux system membrane fusion protein